MNRNDEEGNDNEVNVTLRTEQTIPNFSTGHEWSKLPSIFVEKIYGLLNREDQSQMSLVCKTWSKEYGSASIWKNFRFNLPDRSNSEDICPEVRLARKYGNLFQNVEITCYRIRAGIHNTSCQQLQMFLHSLSCNCQLQSFKISNFGNYFRFLDNVAYSSAFRDIVQFLQSQTRLSKVEFRDCDFRFQEGMEIISALCEGSHDSLRSLVLRRFLIDEMVSRNQMDAALSGLPLIISNRLVHLTSLDTDYSLFFDNMFPRQPNLEDKFRDFRNKDLTRICLHCEGSKRSRFLGLTEAVWQHLKQACPKLRVEMHFVPGSQPRQEIEFFIIPGMPLTLLDFRLDDRLASVTNMEIEVLFRHLHSCKVQLHLQSLYLVWMRPIHDLAEVLLPFVQSCTKLRFFQIFLTHPVMGVEVILRAWSEHRPQSLEEVVISIAHVQNEESYLNMLAFADEYVPLLQIMGLNVYIIMEPGP